MADIVTPILNIVSVLCGFTANNRCCYLLDLQENKDALDTAMEELKAARDDVKRRVDDAENNPNELMKRNHEVDSWLQRVQTIEGEVGEILVKADQEIQGRCFGGYCPKNCWSARKIGKLVIRRLSIVNDLRNKGNFGDVAYILPPSFVQREPVDLTIGMESMFDKVWKSLAEDEVRIMGLYGYGGVGKTTLLKQINNEFLKGNTHGFDVVILVVVSKEVNIHAIQNEIGNRLGLSSSDRTSIFNSLAKKNFVLLLDDIWERVDLQRIGIPRPDQSNKSKVIFTTRSEIVCGQMDANKKFRVECLSWNEAWSLFQEKVGNEALNSHPKVSELAKVVAKECGGLPLALISIGRAMSTKKTVQEWNYAINTLQRYASEFPGMGDEVLPLLKLSYDNLRNDMTKSCFLYCALFPEDHSIKKSKLIDYWIGEGFISLNEFNHIDEARNQGYDVIGNLKGACLLESGNDKETDEVKMHDTIRDLALWIACECGSKRDKMLVLNGTSERSWHNAERIYLVPFRYDVTKVSIKSPNLLTLIFLWPPGRIRIPQNLFEFSPLLRLVDLSGSKMDIFPMGITELLELQYLSLSRTDIKVLPVELKKLVKLYYLDLSYMPCLKKISSGAIGSLLELRVLNLYHCSGVVYWDTIEEIDNLKHLNDLAITINTLTKLSSSSNQNLQMSVRRLYLQSLSSDRNRHSLKQQSATYQKEFEFVGRSIESLEKLKLLSNLETLSLDSVPLFLETEVMEMNMRVQNENHCCDMVFHRQQQQYIGSCFQNLGEIQICNSHSLKDLTWVGYAGNLKSLEVFDCNELEEIVSVHVDDFGGTGTGDEISTKKMISNNRSIIKKMMNNNHSEKKKMINNNNNIENIFKSLETLDMQELPKLKSICKNALAFPCLESLVVLDCPKLKKLPFNYGSNVNNTLRMIQGQPKWWRELHWGEEDHHNNKKLESKFHPYFENKFHTPGWCQWRISDTCPALTLN